MFRRMLVLLTIAALAAVLAGSAVAASIHIRVEGRTRTVFGATEPRLDPATNALDALQTAALWGEFYVSVKQTSFGPYVAQIGYWPAAGSAGWVFKLNGASPPVGADKVVLKDGDTVLWYWAEFDASGNGPKTLRLQRASGGCYRVTAQDDAGKETPAAGASLAVDGRTIATKVGVGCPGAHRGWVRGVLAGAVRSNALA